MKKILGKERIFNFLVSSFRQNKLSHAYLFLGPEGVGKAFTAKLFAQFINCERRESFPCLKCGPCVKIEENRHPDVYWIKPEEGSQGIKIEVVRSLQEKIALKPYEAGYKIFILEKADSLLEEASHCLLKTLEEPPGDALLILLAEEKERIFPTILSRCQIIRFSLINRTLVEEFLMEKGVKEKSKISFYSNLAGGSIGKALALVEGDYLKKRNLVFDGLLEKKDFNYEVWGKEKTVFSETIDFLSGVFRDALFKKLGLDRLMFNIDHKDLISRLASSYSQADLAELLEKLNFYYQLIQQNVNLRLIFTNLEMDLDRQR
ncbi:MAG: DNA polymerase III subunit delta' [Candidatus Omnitrophica bacterium]|nr:DNA polymerase III subunit delta' [Candidatus Omnitrophota bacterium]MCM8798090.1 DNA polymerase III subunit delta' [Candidatus Omnitrophota bacterium]